MNISILRKTAIFLLLIYSYELIFPMLSFALTSGPTQPEMHGFTPIGVTDMVDLSSGDFSYNIPLMDVGGYPINMSYKSGVTMDEEASWVGLGWSLTPGALNRNMRGIPDDFNGDTIVKTFNVKDNTTVGVGAGISGKILGIPLNAGASLGVFYNNYKGPGLDIGLSLSSAVSNKVGGGLTANLNTQSGLDIDANFSAAAESNKLGAGLTLNGGINSRQGLKDLTLSATAYYSKDNGSKNDDPISNGSIDDTRVDGGNFATGRISFSTPTYYPTGDMTINNTSVSFNGTLGTEVFFAHPNLTTNGYYTKQSLASNTLTSPTYGSLYSANAVGNPYAVYDLNREKDIPFSKNSISIAIPYNTFDLFSADGQGMSGQFRLERNDVGTFADPYHESVSNGLSLGIEVGIGDVYHGGVTIQNDASNTVSQMWQDGNGFSPNTTFTTYSGSDLYEPSYFKNVGEKDPNNNTSFDNLVGGTSPVRAAISSPASALSALDGTYLSGNLYKPNRNPRNQVFSYLTADMAAIYALDANIVSYKCNSMALSDCSNDTIKQQIDRRSHPLHHISEVTVTNPDGQRYVYGIPAYNNYEKDVSFRLPASNYHPFPNPIDLTTYSSGTDNSYTNQNGEDHFFESEMIPAYSHSFLLTEVLSPDYVDLTGDGVSDDDLGTAIKLNYTRVYGDFKWRTPYGVDSANYQEGMNARSNDQTASYVYGSKEVWYSHSIESKTMVAFFFLKDRNDALGVTDENGDKDASHKLKALDRIELYSKSDLVQNGNNATPIKTVHFVYNYSLCQKVPNEVNADSGKLTLKEVYFTYGKSTKGMLNGYKFGYGFNPSYCHDSIDRWGNYQHEPSFYPVGKTFPYTYQDSASQSRYSAAWCLNQITLPSGGIINVTYESDDYAYVQNMRAGQMFFIKGFSNSPNYDSVLTQDSTNNTLYQPLGSSYSNYAFIDLEAPVENMNELIERYFLGLTDSTIYFNCFVNIDGTHKEFIKGYCQYDSLSLVNDNKTCVIKIKEISDKGTYRNPIVVGALQTMRLELPEIAYPGSDPTQGGGGIGSIIVGLVGLAEDIENLELGFNTNAIINGMCRTVDCSHKSWVRLTNPTYKKFGGGSRVKRITICDNWADMVSGQQSFSYGQEYCYATRSDNGRIISSGVASWEPQVGGDENPFRLPLPYTETVKCAPNNYYYVEQPLGEALFPAPTIVYSEVKVRNLKYSAVKRTGTGYTVTKFYTAKDFPTLANSTGLTPIPVNTNSIFMFLRFSTENLITASEGFSVEVNDMHGKMKSQETYDQNNTLINGTYYHYKVDDDNAPALHLNNEVSMAEEDGTITSGTIGLDIDVWTDAREQKTETRDEGIACGFDFSLIPPFIALGFPSVFPSYSKDTKQFRSIAVTKFIKRFGIQDMVTKVEYGSSVTTEDLVYDAVTGDPLLTRTSNEFDDPLYHLTYPAHWAYDGMGPAYENIGAQFYNVTISSGNFTTPFSSSAPYFFVPGDELAISQDGVQLGRYCISNPKGQLEVIDENGRPASLSSVNITIIRSGRRNMSSTSVGELSTRYAPNFNPLMGIASDNINNLINGNVIDAKATLYSDHWQTNCFNVKKQVCISDTMAPFDYVSEFLGEVVESGHAWATPDSNITIDSIIIQDGYPEFFIDYFTARGVNVYTAKFYAITSPAELNLTGLYKAKVGLCTLTAVFYPGAVYPGNRIDFEYIDDGLQATLICDTCLTSCTSSLVGDTINPYRYGLMDVWRPQKSYLYYDNRTPALTASNTNIREQGFIPNFTPFWNYNYRCGKWNPDTTNSKWTWNAQITEYDQKGNEIENKDPLNRYSSALFGYNVSLATAVASNARYKDIANDNFEDYSFSVACDNPCLTDHWNFRDELSSSAVISDTEAHTGMYSLRLSPHSSITASRSINTNGNNTLGLTSDSTMYTLSPGGCIYKFSPDSGKYLISAWVKEDTICNCPKYMQDSIKISFDGSSVTYCFKPQGPIIEGWQRYEATFHVPSAATMINVTLYSGNKAAYFDDIRMHPFYGNMKTFVYDPVSLRLVATLDENNYATFYEYDDEGNLIRIKRETEKGVMTIQEDRTELKPNN